MAGDFDYRTSNFWFDEYNRLFPQPITAKEKTTVSSLVKRVKNLTLSKDDRVLRAQGFVDENGIVTDEGARVLREYLFAENKDAMAKIAHELAAEDKAAKK